MLHGETSSNLTDDNIRGDQRGLTLSWYKYSLHEGIILTQFTSGGQIWVLSAMIDVGSMKKLQGDECK